MKYVEYNNKKAGFSLMELLVYTAVLVVMSMVIVSVFLSISKGRGQFEAQAEVNSNLRFITEKINQDIRAASLITTPASAGASTNNLVLTVGDTVEYCISSNKLRRQVDGTCGDSSPVVHGDKVVADSITFTRYENTNTLLSVTAVSVQTSVTISYAGTNPDYQYSATKTTTELLP